MDKFEIVIVFIMLMGWIQLIMGLNHYSFFTLGTILAVILMEILSVLRNLL